MTVRKACFWGYASLKSCLKIRVVEAVLRLWLLRRNSGAAAVEKRISKQLLNMKALEEVR
uniref:Uncharacterized protein n=1 Tax=Candidatus Kentrum sp. DK TaxID=2126562 RepID=A0A450SY38_9GAMM|nr:MAG: hypothetical protein BECKDK2373C_GA0170839_10697 [Candidatus Kentron sp. DK]